MKHGGHVKKMNDGGRPKEDEPLRQDKRKAKELDKGGRDTKEETADEKGDMKYAKGSPSNWLQCDGIIHANGKRQLVIYIDGKWRP